MSNTLEIKNLSKYYKDFKLDHISLNIPSGMVMGLIGENGAGKSTLINSILGITKSEYQSLKYFGKDFKTNEKEIKEKIAVIFDSTHYNQKFTPRVIEKILRKVYTNWDSATYHQYLKKFNLPLDKRIEKFSRGMKMKMEFAIAFSHHAKFLILDEATSGLDPIVRDEVLSMIREFVEEIVYEKSRRNLFCDREPCRCNRNRSSYLLYWKRLVFNYRIFRFYDW